MSEAFAHQPVMVAEVVALLEAVPAGIVIDATVGGGGHARALLEAHPGIRLLGLDRDGAAIDAASRELAEFGDRVALRHGRFDRITKIFRQLGDGEVGQMSKMARGGVVAAVLFDLGVSSAQLDVAERGFSYRFDAPLDMRMDRDEPLSAADVVNDYEEVRLATLLARLGDERFARRIAGAIVAARPIRTTAELAGVVRSAIPAPARRRGPHPARRTFQALRIAVNNELEILPSALDQSLEMLVPQGRCVVLAYHSGEDRIVKDRFTAAATGGCVCPPGLPCACGAQPIVRHLGRKGRKPRPEEVAVNRRAESARLRAVERLGPNLVAVGGVTAAGPRP